MAPTVALLRDPPFEDRLSMERYADEIQSGLIAQGRYDVIARALLHERVRGPRPVRMLGGYFDRLMRIPVDAARTPADVYHVVDHGYAHAVAMLPKERSIVTCHDLMLLRSVEGGTGFRGRRTSILRFRWSVSYMRQVAHVICVSDSTRDDVIRLVGVDPDRTSVVRLGIAGHFRRLPDADVQATRARLGLGGRIGVLNVSTGDPNKNVRGVLHVLHRLRRSGTDAVLLRVGRPLTGELRDLVEELDLSTAIVDSGRVDEDELVRVYNAADVLLHPSFYEGFGWPPLEAMACGTPVVSSSTPALLEVVGDVALTAEPTDHAALAACVLRAAEPTCAADLRTRGYAHAAKFTWHRTVAEVTGIYDRVLESVGA